MKFRKVFCAVLLTLAIFAGSAFAANPQDALSLKSEDSFYFAMGFSDVGNFVRWLMSQENIDAFMPLILASKSSNEIIGGIEVVRGITANTPLKSVALAAGVNKSDLNEPFLQMAFTVADELSPIVGKIKSGSANAADIAKLLLGTNSPMIAFAETMIKAESGKDGIYTIDNVIKLKAVEDLIILTLSDNDMKSALNALDVEGARLFHGVTRKFNTQDFVFAHMDFATLKALANDEDIDKITKYFDKPLNIELGFKRVPDKFTMSLALNVHEALAKKYAAKVFTYEMTPVKGCNINLSNAGGSTSPILALGGIFNITGLLGDKDTRKIWEDGAKYLEKFTGITESEFFSVLNGPISLVINDSINIESFKIPALYLSLKGEKGAAAKIFEKLSASHFFSRIQDKILQLDSSISPVSFLIVNHVDSISLNIADLASLNETPKPSAGFAGLLNQMGISALWIDFAGIQRWIADNKVMEILTPMAKMFGYGKIADDVASVLSAKFSVPSFALRGETDEIIHLEFTIDNSVSAEDGVLVRLVRICRDYMTPSK